MEVLHQNMNLLLDIQYEVDEVSIEKTKSKFIFKKNLKFNLKPFYS
jgi:hypothetical protein